MEIHAGCQCQAYRRFLSRHRGKRSHCRSSACRHQVQVTRKAREESVSAILALQAPVRSQARRRR